jgi:transketolase
MLRVLPNIKVLCPGDPMEVRACVRAAIEEKGPVYMRIGKKGEAAVHERVPEIQIGKCLVFKKGKTVGILNAGNTLPLTLEVASELDRLGVSTEVASFHTVKPLDEEYLQDVSGRLQLLVTVEEHSIVGGFGSAVAEWMSANRKANAQLLRFGTADEFLHVAGDQAYARKLHGLTRENIVTRIVEQLQ